MKILKGIVFLSFLIALLASCNEHKKVLKSTDLNYKYEMALKYYQNEKYFKAYPLFEELIIVYRGRQRAEELQYLQAYTDYKLNDLLLASVRFKNFVRTYPNSKYTEECLFMSAFCYYKNSPRSSLDQTNTRKAINELQLFMNQYPNSERVDSSNVLLDKLRAKLEVKSFNNAKQLYHMRYYKSTIAAMENMIDEFPGTKYTEEARFISLKSAYLLALNSVSSKKEVRIDNAIDRYVKFVDFFSKGEFIKDAEEVYVDAKKEKEKLLKKRAKKDGLQKN